MKMKMKILQKTKQFLARNQGAIALGTVLILVGGEAAAYPVPTSPTSFLYSAYDVIINKLSKGAVGFSVAAAMTIGALVAAIKNQFSVAAVMVVATFIGANLETTITSLGITTLLM
ncbi:hypothetical protein [uncultured Gammaproteobacteria bacterium]|nr:hypothetical protein [uncultured Gammaproteobacteria bacterium]